MTSLARKPSTPRPVSMNDVETKHLGYLVELLRRHLITDLGVTAERAGLFLGPTGTFPNLRPSHFRLLSLIPRTGARLTDLTDVAGMTKQGLGQFVDELQGLGYVASAQNPADRRSRVITRTAAGDEAVATTNRLYAEVERVWSAAIGARRWATFRSVLSDLAAVDPG